MIDFRYHLVSLIAVFLAIALGIVIGTTQLNGRLVDNLQSQVSGLQEDKRSLETQTQQLQGQLDDVGSFEEAVGPSLVRGTLTGRSVVLVVADNDVPSDAVEGVTGLLGSAGARVTGTVRLTGDYTSPSKDSALQNYLTGTGLPAGTTPPTGDDVGAQVASLLAQVLMVPGPGAADAGIAPDSTATSAVLTGLGQIGVLDRADTGSVSAADFAVVLTVGTIGGRNEEARTKRLVQLAAALDDRGSGTVVAGDAASAGDGGLLAALRDDDALAGSVSTVDNLIAVAGQISTVLAVAAEGRGDSGAYGTADNTQPVPAAAP
ncbi:copper transporter [Modestobacter sp. NPDC049651]|uniref:copper transporter n=1 Tax=unclassified Modestobacter TaxID=2643866 RepID=UPI0033F5769D